VEWIGWIWLRIGTSGGLLWTRYWTFGFHKMLGSSWGAAQLTASQEGLSSMNNFGNMLSNSWEAEQLVASQSKLNPVELVNESQAAPCQQCLPLMLTYTYKLKVRTGFYSPVSEETWQSQTKGRIVAGKVITTLTN
jgi:hypothetical protein